MEIIITLKVVVKEFAKFVMLSRQIRKVDEESTAHVALHRLYLLGPSGPIVLHQEIAIL